MEFFSSLFILHEISIRLRQSDNNECCIRRRTLLIQVIHTSCASGYEELSQLIQYTVLRSTQSLLAIFGPSTGALVFQGNFEGPDDIRREISATAHLLQPPRSPEYLIWYFVTSALYTYTGIPDHIPEYLPDVIRNI